MDRELLDTIGKMMDDKLKPLEERMIRVEDRVVQIDDRLTRVEDRMVHMDDRLTRVEDRVTRVEDRSIRTEVLLENDIVTKINLLYEGFTTLLDEVRVHNANARELSETKDRVQVLETVVKTHSEDIQDIKKKIG